MSATVTVSIQFRASDVLAQGIAEVLTHGMKAGVAEAASQLGVSICGTARTEIISETFDGAKVTTERTEYVESAAIEIVDEKITNAQILGQL